MREEHAGKAVVRRQHLKGTLRVGDARRHLVGSVEPIIYLIGLDPPKTQVSNQFKKFKLK